MQAFAPPSLELGLGVLISGRAVVGAAVGLASAVVPVYIAEVAPRGKRGRAVTVQSLFITGGQVVAYLVGWIVGVHWRWGVGLGAVPALLQAGLLWGMPESPRWLVKKGREGEAREVLMKVGEGEAVLKGIRWEVEESGKAGSWKELWRKGNRRALGVACGLQGLQQLCGFVSPHDLIFSLPQSIARYSTPSSPTSATHTHTLTKMQ